ncbi:hypothetical protein CAL7716_052350 [Calothrix sp. PCC 7716]|nr:hypothetical protein CAL7716_052350 [Calothrix sp. PCC 7716]
MYLTNRNFYYVHIAAEQHRNNQTQYNGDKTMTNEINTNAIELSIDELDTVAGGLAISLGDIGGFTSDAGNSFSQKNLAVGQQTFAGPGGSYTGSVTNLQEIFSKAGQSIAAK